MRACLSCPRPSSWGWEVRAGWGEWGGDGQEGRRAGKGSAGGAPPLPMHKHVPSCALLAGFPPDRLHLLQRACGAGGHVRLLDRLRLLSGHHRGWACRAAVVGTCSWRRCCTLPQFCSPARLALHSRPAQPCQVHLPASTSPASGLGCTLLWLAMARKALPALPISIVLAVTFYFLSRFVLEPILLPQVLELVYY